MRARASLRRFNDIFRICSRHMVLHILHHHAARWPKLARKIPGENLSGPRRFRLALEQIGGTFIKFGQMLAMQSDMLPLEYCAALFSLFDQVPPFDYAAVEQTFREDLGQEPLEIFETFDPEPIATGSIGQVHVATLNGRKVAVKVRRPTIQSDFYSDIAAMRLTVHVVKVLHIRKMYWLIAPTEEFIAWTQEELDYRREAHYMDELGRNARENAYEKVPLVFWSCTTARILTAEYLEGLTVSEYLRQKETGRTNAPPDLDPQLFAARLIDNFLGDAFRHGMFHADLHPGNLMILPGNIVGYIDFGISGVLSRYSRRHLISMTLAYARGDLEAMCESFFKITTFDRNATPEGFRRDLQRISSEWYGGAEQSRLQKSITSIMLDLLVLSRQNRVWPQRDVIKYIRSAIAIDGLIKTFAPGVDVGLHLEAACERHLKWDAVHNLVSPEAITGWLGGNTHLVRDGLLRAFSTLRRAGTENLPAPIMFKESSSGKTKRWRTIALQLTWIGACGAMMWQPLQLDSLRVSAPLFAAVAAILVWQQRPREPRRNS
jgi:ubiquinone biosynthesis protein